jgi:hypothetical protein
MDDEANFIDQTRSSMGLYRVHRPGPDSDRR